MKSKVIVGMSGGVDSAVSAYLLQLAGYDVIGVTLLGWEADDGTESRCCEIDEARRAAWKLNIPHYVFNCVSDFRDKVIKPFTDDYLKGLTPNPCIECNRYVKWERMLYAAKLLNACFIATGHYASVVKLSNGRYTVKKALHVEKDQSYMLYKLTQEQLALTIMPLGTLGKEEVRQLARNAGLSAADKRDSQEICFVLSGKYADYIKQNAGADIPGQGNFVDEKGNVLGLHEGIFCYTVGQRKGLGLSLGYPAYVKQICSRSNEIVIGREESLYNKRIICRDTNFLSIPALDNEDTLQCVAKIRYHDSGQNANIKMKGDNAIEVAFDKPVRAATPGQSAVFYDDDGCVICGGIISEVM